jgi:DNA-3-methyladenine glycosylase II
MAQQLSTAVACKFAERAIADHPYLAMPSGATVPELADLRAIGLSEGRARCLLNIIERSDQIRSRVSHGQSWEVALTGIKGIGPWTIRVFRIMVLRDCDVLPLGDIGLERAIFKVYGHKSDVEELAENWRPFRSVACWYLWRTLGNKQLG